MDSAALATAMGCSLATANRYVDDVNLALLRAQCTTVNRAAMYCAQVGHESSGLVYMEELASGKAYEGRADLGNTVAGDGVRFKGRGPIQLTGRHNYGLFGQWAASQGLVDSADYFVRNPTQVATSRWGFLAASWYWTVARPRLNAQADAGDVTAATESINGGTNGLADRITRWNRCRGLNTAVLPSGPVVTARPVAPAPTITAPEHRRHSGDDMPSIRTPEPAKDQAKWDWPTTREILSWRPGTGLVKLDHGGRGGWVHAIIWWVRDPGWTPNLPKHHPQNHPVTPKGAAHDGSERFVGYGWESAPPTGADMVEVVFSAPDSAVLQFWRTD